MKSKLRGLGTICNTYFIKNKKDKNHPVYRYLMFHVKLFILFPYEK